MGDFAEQGPELMTLTQAVSLTYCAGLTLLALGATYWIAPLGYLGASPGVMLILVAALIHFASGGARRTREGREALLLLAWGVATSIVSLALFGGSALYASKTLTLALLSFVWIAPIFCVNALRIKHLQVALWIALAVSGMAYVCSDLYPQLLPPGIRGLIFGGESSEYEHERPRGFMQENSFFASLVGRDLILLYLIYESSRRYSPARLALVMASVAALLAFLGSKGAAVSIAAALVSIIVTKRQLPFFLLLAPILWSLAVLQIEAIAFDLENFTSTSTRLVLSVAALASIAANPLGYGYYGMYGAIQAFGVSTSDWLSDHVPLILTELTEIVEDLVNVSTKSTLLDFTIVFGAPFLWLLISWIRRINLSDPRARAALVYLLLSSLSTSGHESIGFFLGLATLMRLFSSRKPRAVRQAPVLLSPQQ